MPEVPFTGSEAVRLGLLDSAEAPALEPLLQRCQLRQAVEQRQVELDGSGELLQVTISVGGARHRPGVAGEATQSRADEALYAAKNGGRNRVELA